MLDCRRVAAGIAALTTTVVLGGAPSRAETPAPPVEPVVEQPVAAPSDPAESEVYDPLFGDDPESDLALDHDPFESANRVVFLFNDTVDQWVLDPVTRVYQLLVPAPLRRGINRAFLNLNAPIIFSNEVMQLRGRAAARTLARFVANTSLGLGGFYDFAEDVMRLPRTEADFGQTLYRYGVPRGPYVVVPLIGPSTARDAVGTVVDQTLTPVFYLIGPLNLQWQAVIGGGHGLAVRDANDEALDALRDASVDFYAALRSAYIQSRHAKELEVGQFFGGAAARGSGTGP